MKTEPPTSTPSEFSIRQAGFLLACGQPQQALLVALDGLARSRPSAELYHLAGACAAELGDVGQAEMFWLQALVLMPHDAPTHFRLGLLAENRGQLEPARQWYRQAIAHHPEHAQAHQRLAVLLAGGAQDEAAQWHLRRAVALAPDCAAAHCNLGVWLARRACESEAEQCYRQALALEPEHGLAHANLGVLLVKSGRDEEAEWHYRRAIACSPDSAEAHGNLGLLLEKTQRGDEAEPCLRRAVALAPGGGHLYSNLANFLAGRHAAQEAEQYYRLALTVAPGLASVHSNLGVLLASCGRDAEAEACLRQAIALDPDYPLARLNLAFLLLGQGRCAEGWALHEARNDPGLPDGGAAPSFAFPRWRGEALAGKSLLVWPEQGLGDVIQFCRYIPLLKGDAARIGLACRAPLVALMGTLDGVDEVFSVDDPALPIGQYDYWDFAQSLPLHCHTDLATIPATIPYLRAAPERLLAWRARLPEGGCRVGLVWQGNPHHANDGQRSLPDLSVLAPLWSLPGVQFISLQMGLGKTDLPADLPVLHLGDAIGDFADTAAILYQLDLLISVDSAVAHLAGALGTPCWLLLPAYKTDWRWLRARQDTPWYRFTRLFRQSTPGNWQPVVAQLKEALADYPGRQFERS
ncbi:Flp pilus assembly protein TadD [Oxalobacteraceae bacterium GrIS 1.11]